jgi:metal-responsive CopG/Arc/MetJ family transcriptional regulator
VNITIPEDTLHAVDVYAKRHGYNRSNFLAYAARSAMQRSDQAI